MKKKIEVYVQGCDDCKRHDTELTVCQPCGTALCTFYSRDRASKHKMSILNRYQAHDFYRGFFIDDNPDDYKDEVHLCLDCMMNPTKRIGILLRMLERHEDISADFQETKKKLLDKRHSLVCKIRRKIIDFKVDAGRTDKYWKVPDSEFCGMIKGESIND